MGGAGYVPFTVTAPRIKKRINKASGLPVSKAVV
jgi:hypothetical protein